MWTRLGRVRTHGGNPWDAIRTYGLAHEDLLDFSLDINPLGFPPGLRALILEHLEDLQRYPDPGARALREAIAASDQVPVEAVLPGNGSSELISLLVRLRAFRKALVVVPTFTEYEWALEPLGIEPACVTTQEADGFQLATSRAFWEPLLRDVELVFLCNPNNPTGAALAKERVLELARWCRDAGAILVVDEAYVEFTERPEALSVLPDALELGHVIVLRSLTKPFAIPGLRLGYAVAPPDAVETLRALQPAWPLNALALAVGPRLFEATGYLLKTRQAIAEWRTQLAASLQALEGLVPLPSVTNFLLCKLTRPEIPASGLAQQLARRGLLIRACDDFTGLEAGRFIRLAVRRPEDNARLVTELREALS